MGAHRLGLGDGVEAEGEGEGVVPAGTSARVSLAAAEAAEGKAKKCSRKSSSESPGGGRRLAMAGDVGVGIGPTRQGPKLRAARNKRQQRPFAITISELIGSGSRLRRVIVEAWSPEISPSRLCLLLPSSGWMDLVSVYLAGQDRGGRKISVCPVHLSPGILYCYWRRKKRIEVFLGSQCKIP